MSVAALDGARALDRDASLFLLDSDRGGGGVARVSVLPDVPTNDPRTEQVVDDVPRGRATTSSDDTGMEAAVGGTAGQLVDYDRVDRRGACRCWSLMICLVTYLMLVPILRSLFLPAIAVGLNLLTVAAAFGVLTLLFVGDDPPLGGAGALDVIVGRRHLLDHVRAVDRLPGVPAHADARGVRAHAVATTRRSSSGSRRPPRS